MSQRNSKKIGESPDAYLTRTVPNLYASPTLPYIQEDRVE